MVKLPLGPGRPTEIDWITSKWYTRYNVSIFIIAVGLTWLLHFAAYTVPILWADANSGYRLQAEFDNPRDFFIITFGLGTILASILTILFTIHFLVDWWEKHVLDRDKVRLFFGVNSIREGREMMESMRDYEPDRGFEKILMLYKVV